MTRRYAEEEEIGGAWRARLPRWTVPPAPGRLERTLRDEFRRRHRRRTVPLWAGRAAVVALVVSAVLAMRYGGRGRTAIDPTPHSVTALDLDGFEPVVHMRLVREIAFGDANLDGFEPVAKMTMKRQEGGRP